MKIKFEALRKFVYECLVVIAAVGVSLLVQQQLLPNFYRMPWIPFGLSVRAVGCFLGAILIRLLWPQKGYFAVLGLVVFHIGMDIWSVESFHLLQPIDDTAAGWEATSSLRKLKWLGMYSVASVAGALVGQACGAGIRYFLLRHRSRPMNNS